jgi:hypothetical protein
VTESEREVRRGLAVVAHAQTTGNVSKTCRFYAISRDTFYEWKRLMGSEARELWFLASPSRSGRCPTRFRPNW